MADIFPFSFFNCNVEYSCPLVGLVGIFPFPGSLLLEFTLCVITVCMYSVIHTLWTRSQNHESWAASLVVRVPQGRDLLWGRAWSWVPERPRLNPALPLAYSVVLKPMGTQRISFSYAWDMHIPYAYLLYIWDMHISYMHGIVALTLKNGCKVGRLYLWSAQWSISLVSLGFHDCRIGPIQQQKSC